ncbi:MAG: 3'(2'),5'-bisphosphate nucleotidase CysQ [Nannocystaceae bacterium]
MLHDELAFAADLARKSGEIALEVYDADHGVQLKGAADPVTIADTRINAFVVEALRARFPGDGIVAEESADHGDALTAERCWFVDPLDGTKEFIAKNGEFAIMLGLAIGGRAQLGVVYQPVTDTLYCGVVGAGASLERGGQTRALSVSQTAEPSALRLVVSRSHRSQETDLVIRGLGVTSEQPCGSVGLKVGLIAEQRADLYVHMSGHASRWDSCGPEAILRAAGGRFTDLLGREISYRSARMKNASGILACNAAAYDAVLPVVSAVARAAGLDGASS